MDAALKLKLVLSVSLFVVVALCFVATSKTKSYFGLSTVTLGVDPGYSAEDFRAIVACNAATVRARFVVPILFPIDLLLLVCLGGWLAMTSLALGEPARVPISIIPLLVVVPVLYVACDLAENCLFAWLLLLPNAQAIPDGVVGVARVATIGKLYFAGLGIAQTVLLAVATFFYWLRP